jgi:hypothetical protein
VRRFQVNLHLLIRQAIDLFSHQEKTKNIDLVLNLNSNVLKHILADSVRLKASYGKPIE